MRSDDEPRDPDSRWDAIKADRRTVEEHLGEVMRDLQHVDPDTAEASRLRSEANRLREERQRLADEAGRVGLTVALPHAEPDSERERDRRRIALQILAVVAPWRDARPDMDQEECEQFRVRGQALLNYLDVAVLPYPDLRAALAAARLELASERSEDSVPPLRSGQEPLSTLELFEALPHDRIALAGDVLQAGPVVDGHQAPPVADDAKPS
jgi:hypothetical protein